MNYYIGDLHFGHQNIIKFDKRPYELVEDMDDDLIYQWNKVINKDDDVYILGDMSWHGPTETENILKQLKGNKHLVIGNHDHIWLSDATKAYFETIEHIIKINDHIDSDTYKVIMTHYPVPLITGHRKSKTFLLYAHVHNSEEWELAELMYDLAAAKAGSKADHFNVGCMMPYVDYTPRTLKEIVLCGRRFREDKKVKYCRVAK